MANKKYIYTDMKSNIRKGKKSKAEVLASENIRYVAKGIREDGVTVEHFVKSLEMAYAEAEKMQASGDYEHINVYTKRCYAMSHVMDVLTAHMDDKEYEDVKVKDYVDDMLDNNQDIKPYAACLSDDDVVDIVANMNDLVDASEDEEPDDVHGDDDRSKKSENLAKALEELEQAIVAGHKAEEKPEEKEDAKEEEDGDFVSLSISGTKELVTMVLDKLASAAEKEDGDGEEA